VFSYLPPLVSEKGGVCGASLYKHLPMLRFEGTHHQKCAISNRPNVFDPDHAQYKRFSVCVKNKIGNRNRKTCVNAVIFNHIILDQFPAFT